jgi:hypothetical protein
MFSLLLLAGCFLSVAIAEASASVEAGTPDRAPIAGNYTGPLRPQVHFSPPKGFMNDPNGMFLDADGLYHLYYQCKKFNSWPSRPIDHPRQPERDDSRKPALGTCYIS